MIRGHFRTGLAAVAKADDSPVTLADQGAERAMRAVLHAAFPRHGILGEEDGGSGLDAEYCWVLDPIDGTRAFITGRPSFGTLIGLMHHGTPVLGIVDQPITGERWIGIEGVPTRFTGPFGGRAGTRPCAGLGEAELSCTSPDMLGDRMPAWRRLAAAARRTSWGGDCYAYGLLALGQIDVIAECDLKLWDWATLVPVIEGAGGRLTDWHGETLRAGGDGCVLAVGDGRLLQAACSLLTG